MHYRDQNLISYLESENTPTVNLSVFKNREKSKRVVKDISELAQKAGQVKKVQKPKSEPKPIEEVTKSEPASVDGNIERRVRPLNLDFIKKQEKNITWL